MSELKPCPFCDGTDITPDYDSFKKKPHLISMGCNNEDCLADIFMGDNPSIDEATEIWNTRPIEDVLTARIAGLEAENANLQKKYKLVLDKLTALTGLDKKIVLKESNKQSCPVCPRELGSNPECWLCAEIAHLNAMLDAATSFGFWRTITDNALGIGAKNPITRSWLAEQVENSTKG